MSGVTLRGSDWGGVGAAFPLLNRLGKSAQLSGWVLHPQRSPLGWVGPGGIGGRLRRSREAGGRGPQGLEEQERNGGHLLCPLNPRKPAGLPGGVPTPWRPEAGGMPGPLLFCRA